MHFGRPRGAAAAVTPCTTAQKNNDIARIGCLPDHIFARRGTHDRTDLHSLGHIIGMIDLLYETGCQTDLVAI